MMGLADLLVEQGAVNDSGWEAAWRAIPRGHFVPAFYEFAGNGFHMVDGQREPDNWRAKVEADEPLVTQLAEGSIPTSSSSGPSLMARMLELLDVQDGHRVLEIGTGTGYNAALLCHRLGDKQVVSLDVDEDLVNAARKRLAELGYQPTLLTADGALGAAEYGPFDRIIVTCALDRIPPAWLTQLALGARIVTEIRGGFSGALIVLEAKEPDHLVGRFLAEPGHFMPMRSLTEQSANSIWDTRDAEQLHTFRDLRALRDDDSLRLLVQLNIPNLERTEFLTPDGAAVESIALRIPDGSWIELPLTGNTISYGGPSKLWTKIDAAYRQHETLGPITWNDLSLIVTPQQQYIEHTSGTRWTLS